MRPSIILRHALAGAFLLGLLAVWTCKEVPLTAPNGATMTIQANPRSIAAVGGASTITATVFKADTDGGGAVADGTQVYFTTDLGVIEERVETENGLARATLQSDGRAGTATISARSGAIEAPPDITVEIGGGGDGERVITVVANPAIIGPADVSSEIVATVTDNRANPLSDIPVIFSAENGTMASGGAVLRTNASGQAFDRLTLVDDADSATVTVTSGDATGSTVVSRAEFDDPIIDFVSPSAGNKGTTRTVTIGGQNFQPGATVSFGVGIGIDFVTFVNAETLQVTISINATASSGARDVRVTNPDGGTATLTGAFTVN